MHAQLPRAVYFVLRYPQKWRFLMEPSRGSVEAISADTLHRDIATNEECWIVSTYLRLRQRLSNVYLTDRPVAGEICVVSGLDFGIRDFNPESFYVGTRSDGPAPALCHLTVVQNQLQERQGAGTFIPHWPQPGLIPRAVERGNRIENIVFYGSESNLDSRFSAPSFLEALAQRGVRFRIQGENYSQVHWHDYADADLVLAVRNLTRVDALTKPASKLVNAWLAGVPALLGPEPAFQDLRRSGLDYFEVRTASDVVATVDRLQGDTTLYQRCIRNGLSRSNEFSAEATTSKWISLLSHGAERKFIAWRERSRLHNSARFVIGAVAHKVARASANKARSAGKRILDTP